MEKGRGRFVIIHGENSFGVHQYLVRLKQELELDQASGNITDLAGKGLRPSDLRNACSAIAFMCEYRLVVVRGLLDRFEPLRGPERIGVGRSRQPKSEIEEWLKLLDFVSNLPPSTVLVLLESKLTPGKNLLFDAFSPFAEVTMKGKLGRDDVHRWINDRVREKDGSINEQAVNMLEQLIGDDLWTIENEIEKLLAYRRNSQIDLDDVRLLVSESREVNVFNLVDAILEGIPGKSQKAIQHFISDGESPLGLLSMVCRQLRTIAVATALESGISSNDAALRLGIKPGYPLTKTLNQARAFGTARVHAVYRKALEADLGIKTGHCPDELALILLAGELAASTRTSA